VTANKAHPEDPIPESPTRKWLSLDLGVRPYRDTWGLQVRLVTARKQGALDRDVVLWVEHPPVFTLGRRGGLENVTVPRSLLEKKGVDLVHIERGGDVTYHGPGQVVAYPIIDLRLARLGVLEYIEGLEEIMIQTASDWGIKAQRDSRNRGVWVGGEKLGSIGIALRRGISFHGMALNVNVSLSPFGWINPCGLQGVKATSMERERGRALPMDQVLKALKVHMKRAFAVELREARLSELARSLGDKGEATT